MELKHELIPSWGLSGPTSGKSCSLRCTWCLYKVLKTWKNSTVLWIVKNTQEEANILIKLEFSLLFGPHRNSNTEWKKLQISSVNNIFQSSVGFHICGALMTYDTVSATAGASEQKLKISNPGVAWPYWIFWVQYVWNRCTTSLWQLTDINGFPSQFSNDGLLSFIKGH